jgi:hypothetical protein
MRAGTPGVSHRQANFANGRDIVSALRAASPQMTGGIMMARSSDAEQEAWSLFQALMTDENAKRAPEPIFARPRRSERPHAIVPFHSRSGAGSLPPRLFADDGRAEGRASCARHRRHHDADRARSARSHAAAGAGAESVSAALRARAGSGGSAGDRPVAGRYQPAQAGRHHRTILRAVRTGGDGASDRLGRRSPRGGGGAEHGLRGRQLRSADIRAVAPPTQSPSCGVRGLGHAHHLERRSRYGHYCARSRAGWRPRSPAPRPGGGAERRPHIRKRGIDDPAAVVRAHASRTTTLPIVPPR